MLTLDICLALMLLCVKTLCSTVCYCDVYVNFDDVVGNKNVALVVCSPFDNTASISFRANFSEEGVCFVTSCR